MAEIYNGYMGGYRFFLSVFPQDQLASYDVNGNDHDPTPRYDSTNENKYVYFPWRKSFHRWSYRQLDRWETVIIKSPASLDIERSHLGKNTSGFQKKVPCYRSIHTW